MTKKLIALLMMVTSIAHAHSQKSKPIPLPTIISEINYFNKTNNTIQPLEKGKASFVSKAKGMGFGGVSTNFELPGDKSSFRLSGDSITFIVTLGDGMGEPSAWFNFFKADIKKGKRIGTLVNNKMYGKASAGEQIITFTTRKLEGTSFEIIPSVKLEKGEYMFVNKGTISTYGGVAADAFSFGIDN